MPQDRNVVDDLHGPAVRPPHGLHALVIEDEPDIAEVVADYLQRSGFTVTVAPDGQEGLAAARMASPAVVILDLGLPSIDGVEVCRQLRTFTNAYIVMVTARADEVDTVIGLSVGADDYLTKPFRPRELMARIDAMLRRPRETPTGEAHPRTIGELTLDPRSREVQVQSTLVELTRTEFDVLEALTRRPSVVFSREQLLTEIWGPNWVGDTHVVEVHVASLRRKLGDSAAAGRFIRTVRGVGYRMGDGQPRGASDER
ncbi:response regulator transcription factor [Gordonia terrae]|uniref:DNA-binding response regulator n=2 Tax=Gordonia terrae TaxID=2055 RepID=A0AAD0K718_9ACTN|nr:response regulator transcription factor [Gordonia terrae]ANY23688.1 DNA-binding response regulator [Gordonia terrae]AWO84423.1 DNA-binding response regulator [Gordonia terrae]GAB41851.1 putative two-component response regulator [Gordonia terrae NBRC 100016]